ncbi:MAG: hypothetical protein ACI4I6_05840 [Hominimerdicola sp.]
MKNRIALKAEPRRTAIVLLIFTIISLFIILVLVFSVNKDCMQLNSLIQSNYDYSVKTQEPVLENDYYQFNAGIDFTMTADSQTSLNADIIMQTGKSGYTDLVYWNANVLSTHGIAVSKNIAKTNGLCLGDKLYSKHIVNDEVCEYAIEQIIPEAICVRTDKVYSNGIIIMGYDSEYVDYITHNCIVFTSDTIDELTSKCSGAPQSIIYRDDEIRSAILNISPYLAIFSLISIASTIVFVCVLIKGIACDFRRLIMLGFEKKSLNQVYHGYIYKSVVTPIIISLVLSNIVFLFVDITIIRIMLVIWIPLIELVTFFIVTTISNRWLWRK